MRLPKHGSNPKYIYEQLGLQMPDRILDFSVNLNPLGPPESIFEQWNKWKTEIIDYPDSQGQDLKNKIAKKEEIHPEHILLGNGAAELIQLIAIHFRGKNILLLQPTFSEYERMCVAHGATVTNIAVDCLEHTETLEKAIKNQDALFLCHPNNPTGELYDQQTLENVLHLCEKNKCYLILDEAFYDFSDEVYSMVSHIEKSDYLLILRSVTKMYAIAGIRLGMLFAERKLVDSLRSYQPYWSVNALALQIGETILDESIFVERTQRYISDIRKQFFPKFKKQGFLVSNSKVNFFLLRDPDLTNQKELLLFLLKRGIVPRHTENYPYLSGTWLRFAIRPMHEMDELVEVLSEWMKN